MKISATTIFAAQAMMASAAVFAAAGPEPEVKWMHDSLVLGMEDCIATATDPCVPAATSKQIGPDTEVYWRVYGLSDKDVLASLETIDLAVQQQIFLTGNMRSDVPDEPSSWISQSGETNKPALLNCISWTGPVGKTDPIALSTFKASRDIRGYTNYLGKNLTIRWTPYFQHPLMLANLTRSFNVVWDATNATVSAMVPRFAEKSKTSGGLLATPHFAASGVLPLVLTVASAFYL
ncbi:hypothetical protein DFS34DRAFT_384135 [Phlyctochytrium arcticum]|nr:hypothetical protein DFS34DRAFT_384135 [Phlyctochytrium arcticum]